MRELSEIEVGSVAGGIPVAAAAVAVALGTAGATAFFTGVAAGYTAMKEHLQKICK